MNIININQTIQGYGYESNQYKNVVMSVRFFIPLEPINNTKTSLLAHLIRDRNKKFQSKAQMQSFRDHLYGANISSRTFSYGPTQVLEVRLGAISERFVNEPLQSKQLSGLADLIYQPLINKETLNEAKRALVSRLNRAKENPMTYSVLRTFEELGTHSTLGLNPQGNNDDLNQISVEDMIQFHEHVIYNVPAQIVIAGNFNPELINRIGIVFKYHEPLGDKQPFNLYHHEPLKATVEIGPVNQATLIEAYQTDISIEDPLYAAYRLGNVILGQLPTSHLFQEVREKNSLAYSVSSRTIAHEGLLLLTTSLDAQNIELASDLMKTQVERIKEGDFTDAQYEAAKQMIINSLDSISDDEYAVLNFVFDSAFRNLSFDVNDHKEMYQLVTKDDILSAFKETEPIFQYQLKGVLHEETN